MVHILWRCSAHSSWLAFLLVLLRNLRFSLAGLVNVTIDDKFGDPTTGELVSYSPPIDWNDGTNCTGCTSHPDVTRTYMNSWHDGTFSPAVGSNPEPGAIITASVPFTGSAVYMYCIIAHSNGSPDGNTDMLFLLDGERVGSYQLAPNGSNVYEYNVPVYVNTSIPNGRHIISLESGHGGQKALVMLDYITYSHTTVMSARQRTAIIVGSLLGFFALVGVIIGLFVVCRMRRRSVFQVEAPAAGYSNEQSTYSRSALQPHRLGDESLLGGSSAVTSSEVIHITREGVRGVHQAGLPHAIYASPQTSQQATACANDVERLGLIGTAPSSTAQVADPQTASSSTLTSRSPPAYHDVVKPTRRTRRPQGPKDTGFRPGSQLSK